MKLGFIGTGNLGAPICANLIRHGHEVLAPLRNPELFSKVQIDPEAHTLVWPTGADFDPAMLHDWPEYADALNAWARELERQTV